MSYISADYDSCAFQQDRSQQIPHLYEKLKVQSISLVILITSSVIYMLIQFCY